MSDKEQKVRMILVSENFANKLLQLNDAIGNLDYDADAEGIEGKYDDAIRVLEKEIWERISTLNEDYGAEYTKEESKQMLDNHWKKRKEK